MNNGQGNGGHKSPIGEPSMPPPGQESFDRRLPSNYQIYDKVIVDFGNGTVIKNCQVEGIRFTKSKVFYDLVVILKEGSLPDDEESYATDLIAVDSAFVLPKEN